MKIKLFKALWNRKAGEEIEVSEHNAKFAIRKGYAEEKAEPTDYKNKAEKKPKKNK